MIINDIKNPFIVLMMNLLYIYLAHDIISSIDDKKPFKYMIIIFYYLIRTFVLQNTKNVYRFIKEIYIYIYI